MKRPIFIDTGFIIALMNEKDENHSNAKKKMNYIKKNSSQFRLIFSDFIFDEIITMLKSRKVQFPIIEQTGKILLSSILCSLLYIQPDHFNQAWDMVQKYKDKDWSFTDCTSFILMKELGITNYLGYDEHFAEAILVSWNIPID